MRIKAFCSALLVGATIVAMVPTAVAQGQRRDALISEVPVPTEEGWRTETLSQVDRTWMDGLKQRVDDIARTRIGQQLRGDASDLELLQRLLDERLIPADDTETLQGMGVVLGEQLQRDLGLSWTIYIDRLGRSRALEIPGTNEFLFPVTMISRRVEAGAEANVQEIYDRAREIVTEVRNRQSPF
ncbi:MAG: DUF3806 domain-containing protein [Spongiibacteraceae bacterium]|jgi:hypothetical protein|nr:DUF3806 domain-containing protein [Spongiibacteraceae bacterium]